MEETKLQLQDLAAKFRNPVEKQILLALNSQRKLERAKIETVTKDLQENVQLFKKKNMQLEGEVRRYAYTHSKKSDAFLEINNEKLRLAKKIVELEDENEKIKAAIGEAERCVQDCEEKIRSLSRPSFNEIYLEIVKGFGVEFIERDGQLCCRIKNKKLNDVFVVDIRDDTPAFKTCNAIWEKM